MRKLKVVFKTIGGHKAGMGDIFSSLALAKEFSKYGHDVFFIINKNQHVSRLVSSNAFKY